MAKKIVSVVLRKQKKPLKNISKSKKFKIAIKKIFDYMKSDTYMFSPLLHPQSAGELSKEPIMKITENEKKLTLGEYLKCDCYMYGPLITKSACDNRNPPIESGSVPDHQMEERTEETAKQDGEENLNSSGDHINEEEDGDINRYNNNPRRRIAVRHMQLRREKVKHVIHQDCRPSIPPAEKVSISERAAS